MISKKAITYSLTIIAVTLFLGLIALSTLAQSEGTLGESSVLNFLADYFYFLTIPIFWMIEFLVDHTNWSKTAYFVVSTLTVSLIYTFGLDRIATFIYKRRAG